MNNNRGISLLSVSLLNGTQKSIRIQNSRIQSRLQSIKTTKKFPNFEIDIRKRLMKFFRHLSRLPQNRLTKRITDCVTSLQKSTPWLDEIRKDLKNENIRLTDMLEHTKEANGKLHHTNQNKNRTDQSGRKNVNELSRKEWKPIPTIRRTQRKAVVKHLHAFTPAYLAYCTSY